MLYENKVVRLFINSYWYNLHTAQNGEKQGKALV